MTHDLSIKNLAENVIKGYHTLQGTITSNVSYTLISQSLSWPGTADRWALPECQHERRWVGDDRRHRYAHSYTVAAAGNEVLFLEAVGHQHRATRAQKRAVPIHYLYMAPGGSRRVYTIFLLANARAEKEREKRRSGRDARRGNCRAPRRPSIWSSTESGRLPSSVRAVRGSWRGAACESASFIPPDLG